MSERLDLLKAQLQGKEDSEKVWWDEAMNGSVDRWRLKLKYRKMGNTYGIIILMEGQIDG